jgi:hypothetical protein
MENGNTNNNKIMYWIHLLKYHHTSRVVFCLHFAYKPFTQHKKWTSVNVIDCFFFCCLCFIWICALHVTCLTQRRWTYFFHINYTTCLLDNMMKRCVCFSYCSVQHNVRIDKHYKCACMGDASVCEMDRLYNLDIACNNILVLLWNKKRYKIQLSSVSF